MTEARPYLLVEEALRRGARLDARREPARDGGYVPFLALSNGEHLLAESAGLSIGDALADVDHVLQLRGSLPPRKLIEACPTCAMDKLDRAAPDGAASALDAHILDGWPLWVEWSSDHFRLVAFWRREARPPREIMQRLIAEGVPTRWCHGEYVWRIVPGRSRTTGEWKFAGFESESRPARSTQVYPTENRRIDVEDDSLLAVLAVAEKSMMIARWEDEEWHRSTRRVM